MSFAGTPVPWCQTGYEIDSEIRPGKHVAYYAGLYYVQEPTAMIPAEALSPKPGDMVLDLCGQHRGERAGVLMDKAKTGCSLRDCSFFVENSQLTS